MDTPRGAVTKDETFIPIGSLITLEEAGVDLTHHFVGPSYAKVTHIAAGKSLLQHRHKIDHVSMLVIGKVVIDTANGSLTVKAPWFGTIPAHTYHQVTAIEDALWACIWENPDGLMDPEALDRQVAE